LAIDEDKIIQLARGRPAKAGSLIEVGGPVDSVCVTLAIYGEDLEPDWITQALGVQPDSCYRKGDPRRGGLPAHRGGGWFREQVGDAPQTAETLTEALLRPLPEATAEIWSTLSQYYDVQLHFAMFLYSFNRSFDLSANLAWRIAAMRLRIVCDIYAN
jgi:hypothetical protein